MDRTRFVRTYGLLKELGDQGNLVRFHETSVVCQDGRLELNLLLLYLSVPDLHPLLLQAEVCAEDIVLIIPHMKIRELEKKCNAVFMYEFDACKDVLKVKTDTDHVPKGAEGHHDDAYENFVEHDVHLDEEIDMKILSEKYLCDYCDFEANAKVNVEKHMKTKHLGVLNKCDICEYSTTSMQNFKRHKKIHQVGSRIMCDQCEYIAADFATLNSHINSRHEGLQFYCDMCPFKAKWARSITRHKQTAHGNLKDSYLCDQCHYKTSQHGSLKRHIKVMHEEGGSTKQFLKFVSGAKYSCDQCDFKAKYSRSVKRHKQSVHEGKCNYQCDLCDYKSTQSSTLKRHKRLVHKVGAEIVKNSEGTLSDLVFDF